MQYLVKTRPVGKRKAREAALAGYDGCAVWALKMAHPASTPGREFAIDTVAYPATRVRLAGFA